MTEYYELLGIQKNASQDEIKKAYRRLAMKHHPDKGGDENKFKQITEAFEVISDEQKRMYYDKFGKNPQQGQPNGFHQGFGDPFDIFESFFGQQHQGSHRTEHNRKRRQNTIVEYAISVEDAFVGKSVKIRINHKGRCKTCDGKGNLKEPIICEMCRGIGQIQRRIQIGPMQQFIRQHCESCDGKGKSFDPRYQCQTCDSRGSIQMKDDISFVIQPGTRENTTTRISGMGDFTGIDNDLIIRFKYKNHDKYSIDGHHIHVRQKIPIYEALCGSRFLYTHPDGKDYIIHTESIITQGQVHTIHRMGITTEGSLFIHFDIEFPEKLLSPNKDLAQILSYTNKTITHCENEIIIK
tara:strand:- start:7629 stop:8684 length:1056 start_codon:yes stop_codon:yes gene_type:complete